MGYGWDMDSVLVRDLSSSFAHRLTERKHGASTTKSDREKNKETMVCVKESPVKGCQGQERTYLEHRVLPEQVLELAEKHGVNCYPTTRHNFFLLNFVSRCLSIFDRSPSFVLDGGKYFVHGPETPSENPKFQILQKFRNKNSECRYFSFLSLSIYIYILELHRIFFPDLSRSQFLV